MATRRSLRDEIVRRGLVDAAHVDEILAANRVRVNGSIVANPASLVSAADSVAVVDAPSKYVSRGGFKLEGALDELGVTVAGRRCIDAGSSTGGFTDCLLQRDAAHVLAVDVGRAQLHDRLARDARVTSWESRNILEVHPDDVVGVPAMGRLADLLVADLSFTSSARCVPHLAGLVAVGGEVLVMVKPQFEAARQDVPVGGVVRDPEVHARAVASVVDALVSAGCAVRGTCGSRLPGADGNREFFVWAVRLTDGSQ